MSNKYEEFSRSVSGEDVFLDADSNLPPSFPGAGQESGALKHQKYIVKIRSYLIGEMGSTRLEEVLTDCANGLKVMCWEKTAVTKEGEMIITLKWMERVPREEKTNFTEGRRRRRKQAANEKDKNK